MTVKVASLAGFCFGVKRAVEYLDRLVSEKKPTERVYTVGNLIHNPRVVEDFARRGVTAIAEDEALPLAGSATPEASVHIVLRAHGVERQLYDALKRVEEENPFFRLHDMTCPFVAKIHRHAQEETDENTVLVVLGDSEHPEVKGIVSYAKGAVYTVRSLEDCENLLRSGQIMPDTPLVLVTQTTKQINLWKKIELFFKKYCTNAKIFDTICSVTENRQSEAVALARACDCVIVVGGRNSANTRSLYETVKRENPNAILCEGVEELSGDFSHCQIIGITAGASTPRYIIEEVKQKMSEIKEIREEENFAELLESSLKTLNTGDIVTGVITSINTTEIHVDLSTKGTGVLSAEEMPIDPETGKPAFKVGDEIEAFVVRVSDVEGVVGLSRKKIERMSEWKKIMAAHTEGTVLEGKITDAVKGGVIVTVGFTKVFIPASQTGIAKDGDCSTLVGTVQQFTIIDIDEQKNRAVGSIKTVLKQKRKEAQEAFWANIEEGQKFEGTVKSMTSYGAFVDLGGVDGMVHVSELSWSRIKNPAEVVSVGDKLTVFVKSFDKEKKRISLGCKTEETNPWNIFTNTYKEGDVAKVTIVGLTPFGAFAEIVSDVDGLIHISQIADKKIANPADHLTIGQTVDAKIIGIDTEKKKVSLSIRALLVPEETVEEPVDTEEVSE
ncbi:MAG: bifunctional 4-hydroxy-3-methylbut-2-enyl diphosphate reductase/30S ribosomal protein S1 [Clostridia bacterium]|nr:bifunctional 4-hydroxy-3-methylbut-2-enyl diphosphate reductase/30S ribosomal protein S1 [Clostridia bacterium]